MNAEAYIAQAAALQATAAIEEDGHLFCDQLPAMSVDHFLAALTQQASDCSDVSLALVGYGVSDASLRKRLDSLGLLVGHVTTDLYEAAKWRNDALAHPKIIALAAGQHPGVSTLSHFRRSEPVRFARDLLRWAQTAEPPLASTQPQKDLLEALADDPKLSSLVSLTGVAAFLATWEVTRSGRELDAPRSALPRLGLLPDRNLFSASDDIADRLLQNFSLRREIARVPTSRLQTLRRRVKQLGATERRRGLEALERAEEIRRIGDFSSLSALDYEDARAVFKKGPPKPRPNSDEPDHPEIRNARAVASDGGELLIDGEDESLHRLVEHVQSALTDAVEGDDDSASGHYEVAGEELPFEFDVQREVLTWARHFCSTDAWGGLYSAKTPTLENALREYRQCDPVLFEPLNNSISFHDGRQYDLRSLVHAMQRALTDKGTATADLCGLWDRIVETRTVILNHFDILIHQPMLALAGQSALRASVAALLEAWNLLYAELKRHHSKMQDIDPAWTQLLLEAILAVDIVQIRTTLGSGRTSWKAVLLPTHPLHLWRYERITALARGLKLEGIDRSAVLEQLRKPEHYLGAC